MGIWKLWKLLWGTRGIIKEVDKNIAARFSDAWWVELRKRVELKIVLAYEGRDKGWQKLIQADNVILRGLLLFLKSDAVYAYYRAVTISGDPDSRSAAAYQLRHKCAMRTVDKVEKAIG